VIHVLLLENLLFLCKTCQCLKPCCFCERCAFVWNLTVSVKDMALLKTLLLCCCERCRIARNPAPLFLWKRCAIAMLFLWKTCHCIKPCCFSEKTCSLLKPSCFLLKIWLKPCCFGKRRALETLLCSVKDVCHCFEPVVSAKDEPCRGAVIWNPAASAKDHFLKLCSFCERCHYLKPILFLLIMEALFN